MKNQWQPSTHLLGGSPCAEHVTTKELSLFGRFGEIWSYDASTFKAVIYSHRIVRRLLPKEKWAIYPLDEIVISFAAPDLPIWTKRLQVPAKPSTQAVIANQTRFITPAKSNAGAPNGNILGLEPQVQAQKAEGGLPIPPALENANLPSGTQNPGVQTG